MANDPIDVFQYIDMRGPNDCWVWTGAWGGRKRDRRPYFMARGRRTMAYRWCWELVYGETLSDDVLILHKCDNGGWPIGCTNPNHLRKGSNAENMAEMSERQRHGLPATVVRAIRRLLAAGQTEIEIARIYGLTRETVSAIKTKRAYKHLEDEDGSGTTRC